MPGITDFFRFFANEPARAAAIDTKAASAKPLPFAKTSVLQQRDYARRPISVLRHWSRTNEWVRIAINRRKRQISQARWHIVRIDDPTAKPDPPTLGRRSTVVAMNEGHPGTVQHVNLSNLTIKLDVDPKGSPRDHAKAVSDHVGELLRGASFAALSPRNRLQQAGVVEG